MIMPIARPDSVEALLIEELRQVFDSEMQKVDILWDMAEAAKAPELHKTFTKLWDETLDNINHLEEIFGLLDSSTQHSEPVTRRCDVTIANGRGGMDGDEAMLDQADRMWLREIGGYLKAHAYAALLGHSHVAGILQKILENEQDTERHLSELTQRLACESTLFKSRPIEFPGFGFRQLQAGLQASSQHGRGGS